MEDKRATIVMDIPLNIKAHKGNWYGHKICYDCKQVYDGRFPFCINCGSDVWGNYDIKLDTQNESSKSNSHNPEEFMRAGVEKKIKPVVETLPKDKELLRGGDRVPTLTSPCDTHNPVVILDDNELSLAMYAKEYPENWKKITESLSKQNTSGGKNGK